MQGVTVAVSADLQQHVSDTMDIHWLAVTNVDTCTQQHPAAHPKLPAVAKHVQGCNSLLGSRHSTVSSHMAPSTPSKKQDSVYQQPCKHHNALQTTAAYSSSSHSCSSPAHHDGCEGHTEPAVQLASTCSSSNSTVMQEASELPESAAAVQSSAPNLAYSDSFIWQCYYGDPRSEANCLLQRPPAVSPFAAFAGTSAKKC